MNGKPNAQFGPVYVDEMRSIEVRSCSPGARELWVAISARTRSAKNGPEAGTGYFASYESLSQDIARVDKKSGELRAVAVRTVKRYAKELKDAGLLEVRRNRGTAYLVVLRPPSLRSVAAPVEQVEDRRAARYRSVTDRGQKSNKRGHIGREEGTSKRVPYSDTNSSNYSIDQGTNRKKALEDGVEQMASWMFGTVVTAKLGSQHEKDRYSNHESFSKLGCSSWHEAAAKAPSVLRQSFARWRPDGCTDSEFDDQIASAGTRASAMVAELYPEDPTVAAIRELHPEFDIPKGSSIDEADELFERELTMRTGF